MSRGQTTLDFAIGVSLFLLVVAFVLSFVPGMIQPFSDSGQEEMVASNRIADRLAIDALAGDDPYVLDATCTTALFNDSVSAPSHCRFSGSALEESLALDSRLRVNVTLAESVDASTDGDRLCWDAGNRAVAAADGSACTNTADVVYAAGDRVPNHSGVVTATRYVRIEGVDAMLVVRVW